MFCTKCGRQNPPDSHFCAHCGRPAPESQPVITCSHCGQPLPADTNFCPACGNPVAAEEFAADRETTPEPAGSEATMVTRDDTGDDRPGGA